MCCLRIQKSCYWPWKSLGTKVASKTNTRQISRHETTHSCRTRGQVNGVCQTELPLLLFTGCRWERRVQNFALAGDVWLLSIPGELHPFG